MPVVETKDSKGNTIRYTVREPKEKINNSERLKAAGLTIVHYPPREFHEMTKAGFTIAYRQVRNGLYEIATAVCHPNDVFNKKMGTKTAIENFQAGKTIMLRSARGRHHFLETFFIL